MDAIKVQTAINPLLWLTGVTLLICLPTMVLLDDQLVRLALLSMATPPVVATIVAYFILLVRAPDRLQSEDFRLRQDALQTLSKKAVAPRLSILPIRLFELKVRAIALVPEIANEDLSARI